jgi:Uma2 family endonuclease
MTQVNTRGEASRRGPNCPGLLPSSMASLSWTSRELGFAGRRMTADEFFALGETTERLELIDGVIVMSPSPLPLHQALLHAIQRQLAAAQDAGLQAVVFPDVDVQFTSLLVYRPDITVYRAENMAAIPARLTIPPAPDLIIEILSAGSKGTDLITKRDDYERFGVAEYWAVDPADLRIRVWRQQHPGADRFIEAALPTLQPDTIECASIPGFTLDLHPLRALPQRGP